jgi:prepilin-type N-terminal cleavage/methylation domain-containing protein/prepilin-type processing-associated H-X9-DG protein
MRRSPTIGCPPDLRRAFSLVELLVVIAVISMLLAMLVPALGQARSQARRAQCACNVRQLGHALHMYAADYRGRAMPLAYTDAQLIGDGPPIYWWGTNDLAAVDHTRGFTWPYLHSDLRATGVYECPSQPPGTYDPQGAASVVTSTYGYNGYYLSPPHATAWSWTIGHRPWQNLDTVREPSRIFAFADTLLDFGGAATNTALLDPPYLYAGNHTWRRNDSPTTAFRHDGRTVAVFLDGHADSLPPGRGRITSEELQVGSVGAANDPHYVPDWREW